MGFYLVPFRQPNPPTQFLSVTGHWNVSLPSGASLWNGMFGRAEGQYIIQGGLLYIDQQGELLYIDQQGDLLYIDQQGDLLYIDYPQGESKAKGKCSHGVD